MLNMNKTMTLLLTIGHVLSCNKEVLNNNSQSTMEEVASLRAILATSPNSMQLVASLRRLGDITGEAGLAMRAINSLIAMDLLKEPVLESDLLNIRAALATYWF
jgi:hypothetical protein